MFCPSFRAKIKSLLRWFSGAVSDNIDTALSITSRLKALLDNPVADIVTALIPSDLDDKIRVRLISILGEVIPALNIVKKCAALPDLEDQLQCFVAELRMQHPAVQDAILQKVAAITAGKLDGGRLKQHLYDLYTQSKYSVTK